jgi:hypothetical protein
MREIKPPAPVTDVLPRPWLFLAGAIDQDRAERWQERLVADLASLPGTAFNPRRDAWDATWGQDLDDPRFAEQVTWELDALEQADVIACWLPASSQAPISLLELGLHARRGRVVVGCPPGFHRRGNVRAVCQRFAVPHVDRLTDLATAIRDRLTSTAPPGTGAPP